MRGRKTPDAIDLPDALDEVEDAVPAERLSGDDTSISHMHMLERILQNTELANHLLSTLQRLQDFDADALSAATRSTLMQCEEPSFTAPVQARITERSAVALGKKDVTATWVEFVDKLKPDSPRPDAWKHFPSGSQESDAPRTVRLLPEALARRLTPVPLDGPRRISVESGRSTPAFARKPELLLPFTGQPTELDSTDGLQDVQTQDGSQVDIPVPQPPVPRGSSWRLSLRRHRRKYTSREDSEEAGEQSFHLKHMCWSSEVLQYVSCALIAAHIFYMGLEVETGLNSAKRGEEPPDWVFKGDLGFACCFAVELLLRAKLDGPSFFFGKERHFNFFDMFLLVAQLADILFAFLNVGFLRAVRVLRIMRAARALRTISLFTELRLMVMSIISTLTSLFWAFLLLLFVLYLASIAIMQIVEYHVRADPDILVGNAEMSRDLEEFYGSLGASLLTLFMSISGGADWIELANPLRQFSKAYVLIYVLYVSFVVFGAMNVLTAIFVESASQIAAIDQDLAIQDQLRKDKSTIGTIKAMFCDADVDNSGVLTQKELETLLQNPKYIWAMRLVGVDVSEARGLFQLLDITETDTVSLEEFVTGMMRLKGGAKGVDLATLTYESKRMYEQLKESLTEVQNQMSQLEHNVSKAIGHGSRARRKRLLASPQKHELLPPPLTQSKDEVCKVEDSMQKWRSLDADNLAL